MQVTETNTDGLKREFKVVVPASDLEARLNDRLAAAQGPGPASTASAPARCRSPISRRCTAVPSWPRRSRRWCARPTPRSSPTTASSSRWTPRSPCRRARARSRGLSPASPTLAYTVALEVVPPITLADFKQITLERLIAEVTDDEVQEAIGKIAEQSPAVRSQGRGRQGREGRPGHRPVHRNHRRQAVRGRHGRRHRGSGRLEYLHSRVRGPADRHGGGRRPHREGHVPEKLHGAQSGRQGRGFRGVREVDRDARHGDGRRRIRQVARHGVARQAHATPSRSG